ncbi:MAG: methyl-accepting chemotaxis protein [Pseudomonadota bacterium]
MIRLLKSYINKRLRSKILITLTVTSAFLMGTLIYIQVEDHRKDILDKITAQEMQLASMTHAGIKHPMAIGDMDAVKEQLRNIRTAMKAVEVYITDINQTIVYATHEETVGSRIDSRLGDSDVKRTLSDMLATGVDPNRHFSVNVGGEPYNLILHPILNEPACYNCHVPAKRVLGSLVVRQAVAEDYLSIASLRNRHILLGVGGILSLVFILNFLLTRLITRRIHYLADKARQVAEGDVNVSIEVRGEDSIEGLNRSFNTMLRHIRDKIEYANSLKLGISDPFFIVDPEFTITYMNDRAAAISGYKREEVEGKMKCWSIFTSDICETACSLKKSMATGLPAERMQNEVKNRFGNIIPVEASSACLKDSSGRVLGGFKIFHDITASVEAKRTLEETAAREEDQRRYLEERGDALLRVLDKASQGDLSIRIEHTGKEDVMYRLANKINEMFEKIGLLIKQTTAAAHIVVQGANQISDGNQELSQRTQQQAATIEEASGALEQMTANVGQNATNTMKVDSLAQETVTFAHDGTVVVGETVRSMSEVWTASKKIVEIMDLVNEITFQTNLLALNAAVEAARAGEHGRGFAVVATEVRNLAKRSAEAAKDIQDLIQDSINKIEESHKLVGQTGKSLQKISEKIASVSTAISEISNATQEQRRSIEHVNQAFVDMGNVVQQNANLVEELAGASQTLATKAGLLQRLTSEFTLPEACEKYVEDAIFAGRKPKEGTIYEKQSGHKGSRPDNSGKPAQKSALPKEVGMDLDFNEGFEEF